MEPERTTSDGRIDLEPDKPVWLVELSIARDIRPRHKRMAEDIRCIVWQRGVPAFGSDTPAKTRHSERSPEGQARLID